jgi:hypothetical protein
MFIRQQLESARHASFELASSGVMQSVGEPEQALRDLLVMKGVPARSVSKVVSQFVELARDAPITKKLVRAAVYVTIEAAAPLGGPKIIGASSWSEVHVIVDASVAIPFVCAKLYSPTSGRFSIGAIQCVETLLELGAQLVLPWIYQNECASHLLRALDYGPDLASFQDDLANSQNGFVSQYYKLKGMGKAVPPSMKEFLTTFASSATKTNPDRQQWTRMVMSELEPLFRDYGIKYEHIEGPPVHYRREVEIEYLYCLNKLKRSKSARLIDHDVIALSHMRRCISERGESRMCLTWDGAMIQVGRKLDDCGWVVSPHEAVDLVQPYLPLSEVKLCALAHGLARIEEQPNETSARILDRIVLLAKEKLQDWQFREKIKLFKQDLLKRVDISDLRYSDWIDAETDKFLRGEGVDVPERATDDSIDAAINE